LTLTAPGSQVLVPVTFNLRDDVSLRWTVGAPSTVEVGEEASLTLTVGSSAPFVFGEVVACPSSVPAYRCSGAGPFDLDGFFSGPPGTFHFTARREAACGPDVDYYFVARVSLEAGFDELGPFLSPLTHTSLPAAPTEPLRVLPDGIVFNAFGREAPLPREIVIASGCGSPLGWSVVASEPWLRVTPSAGTTNRADASTAKVEIDLSGLDASQGPFTGTLTFSAPGATAPVTVPVVLNLAC
jgi:hypothetical protein